MRCDRVGARRAPRVRPALKVLALVSLLGPGPVRAWGQETTYTYDYAPRPLPLPLPRPAPLVPTAGRVVVVAPTARVLPGAVNNYGRLGSFYPTPYLMVRGNAPTGGGYSPLGVYGEGTMALNGPLSPLRMTTAPVLTYTRGYDGRLNVAPGTSFSAPNLPSLTPVVYPTQGTNYYGFRQSGSPPWWQNASNWIDQN